MKICVLGLDCAAPEIIFGDEAMFLVAIKDDPDLVLGHLFASQIFHLPDNIAES